MRIWKHTSLDAVLVGLSIAHTAATLALAASWEDAGLAGRVGGFVLVVGMTVYNVIVVSHVFTHQPWFAVPALNALVSMLNSVNIGQSVQVYHFSHARNHHRYNNDARGPDGTTRDLSSTYREGRGGGHAGLFRYAFVGAVETLAGVGRVILSARRGWRVGPGETDILSLASREPGRRAAELRQVRLDRIAQFAGICAFAAVDWRWLVFGYLPALYLSFALVNVQNYYEHYGATPGSRFADSVSYYGRIYNLLAFNDGYHQEHHLRPASHWSTLPVLRRELAARLDAAGRVVSPVPALLGFLDRRRRAAEAAAGAPERDAGASRPASISAAGAGVEP